MKSFHEKIAEKAGLGLVEIECKECGYSEHTHGPTCLRDGWPTHCGKTMWLNSQPTEGDKP